MNWKKRKQKFGLNCDHQVKKIERKMERQSSDKTYLKKGPWTAEEDDVLINYVHKCGPRDWSSLRSKGLLPRTGKSCRLRWVNKLRPNLKTGCKFSAEEERAAIELQAQFGNKWAKIATYLPGRTDNDVKNFWSTRRKRLERILKTPSPNLQKKNKGKDLVFHELPLLEVPVCGSTLIEEESLSYKNYKNQCQYSYPENSQEYKILEMPNLVRPNPKILGANLAIHEATPIDMAGSLAISSEDPFSQLSQSQVDLSLIPECREFTLEPCDPNFLGMFRQSETSGTESGLKFTATMPPLELTDNAQNGYQQEGNENPPSPDIFFDDMFDCLEPLPNSD